MKITVFGASGRVGQQVVALALSEGHTVTAFVHSKKPFEANDRLTVVQGDINDRAAVTAALVGSDAVISTLGSWGTKSKNILTTGMQAIIPAMEELSIRRLITLTGSDALWSADQPNGLHKVTHRVLGIVAPKILQDGEEHLRLLDASKLDWTSVRSPVMTGSSKTSYRLSLQLSSPLARIPRAAVAHALVDQLNAIDFVRQAPIIHSK